jgi:hypothetical protein
MFAIFHVIYSEYNGVPNFNVLDRLEREGRDQVVIEDMDIFTHTHGVASTLN